MSDLNITVNGDIILSGDNHVQSEIEAAINELVESVIEDTNTSSEATDKCNNTIAFILPEEIQFVVTYEECADIIDKMEKSCVFRVNGECFKLLFERKGLITLFDEDYLIAPAFAFFHDDKYKPASPDDEMLSALDDYILENRTEFRFGEEIVPALKLGG